MENIIPCADIVPATKAEATQVVVASTEDGIGNNATANGVTQHEVSGEVKPEETVNMAMQHLAAGKRHILISDPNAAVASLALACQLLGAHYGETAFECGEAYFYYGKALLDLARLETGVMGNLDGGKESADNGADEKGKDEAEGSQDETGSEDESVVEEKENGENGNIGSKDNDINTTNDQDDADEVEKEDEEEPSNLQLAWEMLELAKTILVKQAESIVVVDAADDKEAEERAKLKDDVERKVSNAFQTLGELSMENENYQQAIEDLQTCLARRQQMMPEDSRCIAETHYQIGVAQGFNMEFDEAILNLDGAIKVLELRIERLKSKAESVDPTKVGDAFSTREKEIKEIESLIPEIREKIADTKDMKIETHKRLREKRVMEEGIATVFKSGDGGSLNGDGLSKAASTISSSLIRKRPAVDSAPSDAKKAHIDVEDQE